MKKGSTFLEIIVSLVCIMTLLVTILKTVSLIHKDIKVYEQTKKLLKVMDESRYIVDDNKSKDSMTDYTKIDDYDVSISEDKKLSENIFVYKVEIKKDSDVKSNYYIVKGY